MDSIPPVLDLGALYRRYGGLVRKRILRFVPPSEADDALQEVFERAAAKAHTYRGEASPLTWLLKLATRHCINRLRDRSRHEELWEERKGSLAWSSPVAPADQHAVLALRDAWEGLDDQSLEMAVYYWLDGMTHAQIAARTGVSRRTVGNRLVAVEQKLKAVGGGEA